ncbi:tyrosine recombinase XerC [Candidatus Odyssella acanthamoebae]|uniref:tyrosine recombinase XerC n=1 Tax=Candidatus Odyssella acanthamoebae TaxID=91604 RepID=UPI000570AE2A|nr:tyrosine recombinase XerC [Candidatus Paracaedibacter acanthamoebae]
MDDIVLKWVNYLTTVKRYSPHTITAYSQDLRQFLSFLQDYKGAPVTLQMIKELTLKELRAWLSARLSTGFSPRSTARALSTCRSFFKFLSRNYQCELSVISLLESPRIKQNLPRPLSLEQAESLLLEIDGYASETWVGLRDRALFTLLYATGMRISEALSLKGDVVTAGDHIAIRGKGGKTRMVPLMPVVHEAISKYVQSCPYPITASTFLFLGVKGKVLSATVAQLSLRRYRQSVGLPASVTPHALRHTCATHLMQESSDLRGIQELLGHASLSSTQIYTQIDQRQLLQAFTKAHPRSRSD